MPCMNIFSISRWQRALESTAFVSIPASAWFYLTNIWVAHLLAPGAHARRPMVDRIQDIKVPVTFVCKCRIWLSNGIELILVIDGDQDWMDADGGHASVERLRQAGNGKGRMYIIPHAGHHGRFNIKTTIRM